MPTENTASLVHGAASVGTSATLIASARSGRGGGLLVQNLDASAALFVGGSGVTTANGFRVAAGASVSFDAYSGALYGIVASGTVDVRYAETH